ncbi:MAG: hypothetical protein DSY90_00360 [Deltaproteobacteria bacterium]|nr:MAG: hypothetical protein DSY90_00360 [Deltaproteobacteria bacterium]RUA00105.1 MAG: hypothetical protein DSY89_07270 [Deltaproteobacteria bacterium]
MKKFSLIFALIVAAGLLFGCGTAAQRSEFWQHKSMYQDWDHLKYSWGSYKHTPTDVAVEKTTDRKWWGLPVEDGQVK